MKYIIVNRFGHVGFTNNDKDAYYFSESPFNVVIDLEKKSTNFSVGFFNSRFNS